MTSLFRYSLLTLCALILAGSLASCSDDSTGPVVSKPLVSGPATVDFGEVSMGRCKDTTIRYDNTTGKPVTLSSVTFTGAGFEWTGAALPVEIAAGASVDMKVRFCPESIDTVRAILVFKGTGGDSVKVALSGFSNQMEPGTGSIFTYDTYETDAMGTKVSGSDGVQEDIFVNTNTSYKGKSGVYVVSEEGVLNYYAKELNGDVSVYLNASQGGPLGALVEGWKQMPYGSKQQNVQILSKDTTITVPGVPVPVTAKITQFASYAGQTTMQVMGKTYTVDNVTFTTRVDLVAVLIPVGTITNVIRAGYIPSVGYQGTFDSQLTSTVQGIDGGGYGKILSSFEIK